MWDADEYPSLRTSYRVLKTALVFFQRRS
jgi:hypothetical protein